MSRMLLIFAIVSIANYEIETAPVAVMKQYIKPMPGFIPVYIRPGNTPLEEINADLAEAFESYAIKHARLPIHTVKSNEIIPVDEKKNFDRTNEPKSTTLRSIAINHGIRGIQVVIQHEPQHIQKIPKV